MTNASNPAMCVLHTTLPLSFHYKRRATTCCLFGSEFGTKKTQLDESSARLHIWNSLALGPGLRRSAGRQRRFSSRDQLFAQRQRASPDSGGCNTLRRGIQAYLLVIAVLYQKCLSMCFCCRTLIK